MIFVKENNPQMYRDFGEKRCVCAHTDMAIYSGASGTKNMRYQSAGISVWQAITDYCEMFSRLNI